MQTSDPCTSSAIVLQVDGIALQRDPADGEFRIRDLDLAERLGYDRPRDIRKLISSMVETGELKGIHERAVVPLPRITGNLKSGREGSEYWLDRIESLLVVMLGIIESIARQSRDKNDFWHRMEREYAQGLLQLSFEAELS